MATIPEVLPPHFVPLLLSYLPMHQNILIPNRYVNFRINIYPFAFFPDNSNIIQIRPGIRKWVPGLYYRQYKQP